MFNRVQKSDKSRSENSVTITSPVNQPPRQGRERLVNFSEQIESAEYVIAELTEHVARLNAIVVEAEIASRDLQNFIAADSGLALSRYSAGNCKVDEPITKLVSHERTSSDASAAAKVALPHTQDLLEKARTQLTSLIEQSSQEVTRVVALLAGSDRQAYEASWRETRKLHDRMVGFARIAQSNIGDIHIMEEPPKIARFVVLGDANADPFLHHRQSSHIVEQSARQWTEVRARLELNADADVSDLLIKERAS